MWPIKDYKELESYWAENHKSIDEMLKRHGIGEVPCGVSVGAGWIPIVDRTLGKLIEAGWDKELGQVKQKFCQLRIYLDSRNVPEELRNKLYAIIEEAEYECDRTCEMCGKERQKKGIKAGWALCDDCGKDERP